MQENIPAAPPLPTQTHKNNPFFKKIKFLLDFATHVEVGVSC